jgi:hypothetical protein
LLALAFVLDPLQQRQNATTSATKKTFIGSSTRT